MLCLFRLGWLNDGFWSFMVSFGYRVLTSRCVRRRFAGVPVCTGKSWKIPSLHREPQAVLARAARAHVRGRFF